MMFPNSDTKGAKRLASNRLRPSLDNALAPEVMLAVVHKRAQVLIVLIFLLLAALLLRAFWVQVVQNNFWTQYGERQFLRSEPLIAQRGIISDRQHNLLAISEPFARIEAEPLQFRRLIARFNANELKNLDDRLDQLAKALSMKTAELLLVLNSDRSYVVLAQDLQPQWAESVLGEGIPAVRVRTYMRRLYPKGAASAQVIGLMNKNSGLDGLELIYEERLQGRDGVAAIVRDPSGRLLSAEEIHKPVDGEPIRISLDARIQQYAYESLAHMVAKTQARDGAMVVLDTITGEILAMAGYPAFDPNNREGINPRTLRNIAVTDIFEPGSTIKPFFAAQVLDNNLMKTSDLVDVTGGKITVTGHTIHDTKKDLTKINLEEIIKYSSNVGMIKVSEKLRREEMWTLLRQLGFGQPLPLGFPGEVSGRFNHFQRWQPLDKAVLSFGHTLTVNLLQMARAYTVFAREGEMIQPTLAHTDERAYGRTVYSKKTIASINAMLEATVDNGTGRQAQIDGYRVAGKTGTARKIVGGQYAKKYISTFIGFAPVSQPRLLIAVMINEPSNASGSGFHGGEIAAPVFAQVMGHALRLLGIKPDKPFREPTRDQTVMAEPPQAPEQGAINRETTVTASPQKPIKKTPPKPANVARVVPQRGLP